MKSIQILQNSTYYDSLMSSINDARKSIHISIFSLNADNSKDHQLKVRDLLKLLCKKNKDGIDVRVMLGNSNKLNKSIQYSTLDVTNEIAFTFLKSFGVKVSFFQHYKQESSHSKYVVIDDEISFIGSHNFSPRAFDSGNDDSICVYDLSLAEELKRVFFTDWKYAIIPSNSEIVDFDNSSITFNNPILKNLSSNLVSGTMKSDLLLNKEYFETVLKEIENAQSSIDISMFYFSFSKDKKSITSKLHDALTLAHKRGVKIRIVLDRDRPTDIYASYRANKQRFTGLKKAGIDVKFDKKEVASHSKLLIIDKSKVILGSHNWTYGSYEKYQDVSVIVQSKLVAEEYSKLFDNTFSLLN